MIEQWIPDAYSLIRELLLSPGERDATLVDALYDATETAPVPFREPASVYLSISASHEIDGRGVPERPLPLRLGQLLVEPTSDNVTSLEREGLLRRLSRRYGQFGLTLRGGGSPDDLAIMVEFAGRSAASCHCDRVELRRHFLEVLFRPWLPPLRDVLRHRDSVDALLVEALIAIAEFDSRSFSSTDAESRHRRAAYFVSGVRRSFLP